MAIRAVRLPLTSLGDDWTRIVKSPDLALNNFAVLSMVVANATDTNTLVNVALDGVVVFTRTAFKNTTITYVPDMVLRPGQELTARASESGVATITGVAVQVSRYNSLRMLLQKDVGDTPTEVVRIPATSLAPMLVRSLIFSRNDGGPGKVEVAARVNGEFILYSKVGANNYFYVEANQILLPDDVLDVEASVPGVIDFSSLVGNVDV